VDAATVVVVDMAAVAAEVVVAADAAIVPTIRAPAGLRCPARK
jgi:hypothetical protein